jgi:hypothetical protein
MKTVRELRNKVCWLALTVVGGLLACVLGAVAGDIVCFEAEDAEMLTAPMRISEAIGKPGHGASCDEFLEIPEKAGSPPKTGGVAVIWFPIEESGRYEFWMRCWWNDKCGNSVSNSIDGNRAFIFGEDSTTNRWHWVKAKTVRLSLSKGKHSIAIMNREDGIRIDQLLLSKDKRYVPVGIEDATVSAPGAASRKDARRTR